MVKNQHVVNCKKSSTKKIYNEINVKISRNEISKKKLKIAFFQFLYFLLYTIFIRFFYSEILGNWNENVWGFLAREKIGSCGKILNSLK